MSHEAAGFSSRREFLKSGVGAGLTIGSVASTSIAAAASPVKSGSSDLTWLPGWELRDRMVRKEISPVEVTKHFLSRIDRIDPIIRAYITVDHKGALDQAGNAERAILNGEALGPLHGLPVSIKDLYATKGLRTTQGSLVYKDYIPDYDELLVERLRNAGAIIIGKTQTPEFATFPRTITSFSGECVNPWDRRRITGASSGGACAAVAAGMSCFAIASDGGGSTRIPASFNGVFGFQPSSGRIPQRVPTAAHMASAGPATLYVRDAANLLEVIAGRDTRDPSAIDEASPALLKDIGKSVDGVRIAWTRDWGVVPQVDKPVVDAVERAVLLFQGAGAKVEMPGLVLPDSDAWQVFLLVNEFAYHRGGRLLDLSESQQALLSPPTKDMLRYVKSTPLPSSKTYMKVFETRARVQEWADRIFTNHDVICSPVTGMIAPERPPGQWDQPYENEFYIKRISTCYTYIANVLGLPAASVPCGFVNGMPIGMQIIGARLQDALVMRMAARFSEIMPWMSRHPAI